MGCRRTAGFERPRARFLPDIDAWDGWDRRLEEVVADVDAAWIDGTFWDDAELGRDMREVPHPRVRATLDRISRWPAAERAKIRFTHLNHTNPVLDPASRESAEVASVGAHVAREGDVYALG